MKAYLRLFYMVFGIMYASLGIALLVMAEFVEVELNPNMVGMFFVFAGVVFLVNFFREL